MRCVAVALLYAIAAFAQKAVTVDQLPAAVTRFDDSAIHAPLPCTIDPIKPMLNFGLRFQTGYVLHTSLDPYREGKHAWYIVFDVIPEGGGRPVYFLDSIDIPPGAAAGQIAEATGTFLLGEGHYGVKWSLLDDLGRVCRAKWSVDAQLAGNEKAAKISMPPGTVGDFSWHPAEVAAPPAGEHARHITVLMNAAMPVGRQSGRRMQSSAGAISQWGTLVSILGSMLEHLPGVSVRLVVFNQDQQREIFRQEGFTAGQMSQVAHAADGIEQWKVDSHVLLNPAGGWNLLSDLEDKEIHAAIPSDTVVFLGLPEASGEKMPPGMPEGGAEHSPRFVYLRYGKNVPIATGTGLNPRGRGAAQGPSATRGRGGGGSLAPDLSSEMVESDPIEQSVRRMKGKTITISTPAALGKAIESIQR